MSDREAVAKISARESYEALDRDDQQALDRIIRNICEEPYIDPPVKVAFPVPPAVVILYNDREYWVVYHIADNRTIEVWNVGKAPVDPSPYN
jgi:hypothetical protein